MILYFQWSGSTWSFVYRPAFLLILITWLKIWGGFTVMKRAKAWLAACYWLMNLCSPVVPRWKELLKYLAPLLMAKSCGHVNYFREEAARTTSIDGQQLRLKVNKEAAPKENFKSIKLWICCSGWPITLQVLSRGVGHTTPILPQNSHLYSRVFVVQSHSPEIYHVIRLVLLFNYPNIIALCNWRQSETPVSKFPSHGSIWVCT